MTFHHQPVLLDEVLAYLDPRPTGFYVDATVGGAGHAEGVLEASAPSGRLFGVDRDPDALEAARARLAPYGERATLVAGRYGQLATLLDAHAFGRAEGGQWRVDGLLVDAGVSSAQLDRPERGFSFQAEGPLDMRMSQSGPNAGDLIDELSAEALSECLREYGEVSRSRRLARAIKRARAEGRVETTAQLAMVVQEAVGRRPGARIHPATQVFQALRIAVNEELDDLESLCRALPDLLAGGGVVVIISFHSLEDRIVKRAIQRHAAGPQLPSRIPVRADQMPVGSLEVLTRRPLQATAHEVADNPRARSARLRAARRRPLEVAA